MHAILSMLRYEYSIIEVRVYYIYIGEASAQGTEIILFSHEYMIDILFAF